MSAKEQEARLHHHHPSYVRCYTALLYATAASAPMLVPVPLRDGVSQLRHINDLEVLHWVDCLGDNKFNVNMARARKTYNHVAHPSLAGDAHAYTFFREAPDVYPPPNALIRDIMSDQKRASAVFGNVLVIKHTKGNKHEVLDQTVEDIESINCVIRRHFIRSCTTRPGDLQAAIIQWGYNMKFFQQVLHSVPIGMDQHARRVIGVDLLIFKPGYLNDISDSLMHFSRQRSIRRAVLKLGDHRQNDDMYACQWKIRISCLCINKIRKPTGKRSKDWYRMAQALAGTGGGLRYIDIDNGMFNTHTRFRVATAKRRWTLIQEEYWGMRRVGGNIRITGNAHPVQLKLNISERVFAHDSTRTVADVVPQWIELIKVTDLQIIWTKVPGCQLSPMPIRRAASLQLYTGTEVNIAHAGIDRAKINSVKLYAGMEAIIRHASMQLLGAYVAQPQGAQSETLQAIMHPVLLNLISLQHFHVIAAIEETVGTTGVRKSDFIRGATVMNTRKHFDLILQGCRVRLCTMTDVVSELVEFFDAEGAFIFIHRQAGQSPIFDVVTAKDIKDFGHPHVIRHADAVLLAMEHMSTNESELASIVQTIANDRNITTVYAETTLLGEDLASQARTLSAGVSHRQMASEQGQTPPGACLSMQAIEVQGMDSGPEVSDCNSRVLNMSLRTAEIWHIAQTLQRSYAFGNRDARMHIRLRDGLTSLTGTACLANMTPDSPPYTIDSSRDSSPLSPLPSREVTPAVASAATTPSPLPPSPLYLSLLGCVTSHGAFTQDIAEQHIPMENNPRPLTARMGDKAEYWVDQSGDVLHLKFPARLDFEGQWCRLGPYFSLPDSGLDPASLKRARAHFELHLLSPKDVDSVDYPPEALEMCRRVMDTLSALATEVEDARNASTVASKQAVVSPFFRSYTRDEQDHYALVVQSDLLFPDIPNEQQGAAAIPRVSRRDIGKSTVLLSPSKAKKMAEGNDGAGSSNTPAVNIQPDCIRIRDLYDPDLRYAGLGNLRNTKVECPEVRDGDGAMIHPRDYWFRLRRAKFVEVDVYLKLWAIPPLRQPKPKMSDRDKYGSRNFQIILRRMQLLPWEEKGIRRA
ncbi:hypothetical protein P692DRAFT_20821997 [Suillus brevipes Sb2]|nr:hypothetical protein P692DRAFT_20821997 [Suillus brevipes Sb2]